MRISHDCEFSGDILEGYRRSLSREFLMETAEGGPQALATDRGPYAVVISDMRMPGMDASSF